MFCISNSILLVIDVQGHLVQKMYGSESLLSHIGICIKAAKALGLPIICTEQVPQKLGKTNPAISQLLNDIQPIEKNTFSCWGTPKFVQALNESKRQQIIVVGMESHVCVFQTVSDLLKANYEVQVIADAVSSRTLENKTIALLRMHDLGAIISSTEMIGTELIRGADHPSFKDILNLIK